MHAGAFALWFPLVYLFVLSTLNDLVAAMPFLSRPFACCIFFCLTINFGPWAISRDHRDYQNAPGVPCSITALGKFDHTKGGHLVLFDYGLIFPFPSGSTAMILSACMRHGNTPIQPGETRHSMILYMAGGLSRHVAYGFRLTDQLSRAEKAAFKASSPSRLREVVSRFSTLSSIVSDRLRLPGSSMSAH
jgi:hypothetical protein